MRFQWSHVLLVVAAIGMPDLAFGAPCRADGLCSRGRLVARNGAGPSGAHQVLVKPPSKQLGKWNRFKSALPWKKPKEKEAKAKAASKPYDPYFDKDRNRAQPYERESLRFADGRWGHDTTPVTLDRGSKAPVRPAGPQHQSYSSQHSTDSHFKIDRIPELPAQPATVVGKEGAQEPARPADVKRMAVGRETGFHPVREGRKRFQDELSTQPATVVGKKGAEGPDRPADVERKAAEKETGSLSVPKEEKKSKAKWPPARPNEDESGVPFAGPGAGAPLERRPVNEVQNSVPAAKKDVSGKQIPGTFHDAESKPAPPAAGKDPEAAEPAPASKAEEANQQSWMDWAMGRNKPGPKAGEPQQTWADWAMGRGKITTPSREGEQARKQGSQPIRELETKPGSPPA